VDVRELVATQVAFDKSHGFPVDFDSMSSKYAQISKDLIGLIGEIGEFSNVVKKMTLHLERPSQYHVSVVDAEAFLKEELIDALIYVVRLAAILDVDIQEEYVRKMAINAARYEGLK
jgi:NTP pyrophosphatase (non-canonical NTP hydrolase)